MQGWAQVVLTLIIGVVTGALSSAVGVGGAVVSTPGIRALGATAIEGVGSTLPSILPAAFTATLRYLREGLVNLEVVARVAPWGALAAIGGAFTSAQFPGGGHVQMLLTAVLVMYTAHTTWKGRNKSQSDDVPRENARAPESVWRCAAIGLGAGTLSGFLGIGGGVLMVPTFQRWLRLGLKQTVATSLMCVGIIAIPGTIAHVALGTVNWSFAVPLGFGVIPGAHFGSRLTVAVSEIQLRAVISLSLGFLGVGYFLAESVALAS